MSRELWRRTLLALASAAVLAPAAAAQRPGTEAAVSAPVSNMQYEVTVDRAALDARRLHVKTTFDVDGSGAVLLSLPAWTPGAYEISNYARSVSDFSTAQGGAAIRWDKADHDTWRLQPARAGRVTVEFDYAADSLDNAMSWTRPDFALFNGTNLFLYPEGRTLEFASTVRIRTDAGAHIATGLASAGAAGSYRASSYHELVDMPVFVGRFDLDSANIAGKVVRLATYPSGSVSTIARAAVWSQLKRLIPVEVAVFGEAPWRDYTLMQIADSTYPGYSGLEHGSSHVDLVATNLIGGDALASLYAHEIFHAWNVKRLRPADLTPYRYDRPQPTTWLWVSEGITDYYADLAQVRGGTVDAAGFYALTAGKMEEIAATVPFALEDASLNTWMHPRDGTEYSYYPKGSLAGLLLDIQIRDASENKHSLDQVMRELYESTFKKGRGFTRDDWWGAVRRAANGRSFEEFERRYIDGREPYPWPEALRTIGLRLVADSQPRIGVSTGADSMGAIRVLDVAVGTSAAAAGVKVGDILLSVGDVEIADPDFGPKFRLRYAGRPTASPLAMVVRRAGKQLTLAGALAYGPGAPKISEDPAATPRAVRLRSGILRGAVDR